MRRRSCGPASSSVRRSQVEAGRALGLTTGQTFRHVILFQALKAIYPALTSQFVMIMLTTSVVSSIGGTELFNTAAFIELADLPVL